MLRPTPTTARQTLVEATGSPFAPGPDTRDVVAVLDGRQTNDDLEPRAWLDALTATEGAVAVYFRIACDHEWWLAYDPGGEYPEEFDGPYLLWTTYPSGPWECTPLPERIVAHHLEELYWYHDREERCDIYRSRVVRLEDAPEFVRRTVSDDA